MTEIDRRQFIASMAATATSVTAQMRAAAAMGVADRPPACAKGFSLLAANRDRVRDIGPGWLAIVAAALEKMSALDPALEIRQIKQKFGGLRIYYGSEQWKQLRPAAEEAEALCEKTCEECGRGGSLFNQNGSIRTLCQQHQGNER